MLGQELREVEVQFNPRDLRFIVVHHRSSGFVAELRSTDQIYAAMTNVNIQMTLVRRKVIGALAREFEHRAASRKYGKRQLHNSSAACQSGC